MDEHDKGLVEKLKEKLYKRGSFKADVSRSSFSRPREVAETDWTYDDRAMNKGLLHPTFLKKFFFFALAFFVLALFASVYIIWSGSNVVSGDNLEINLDGPTSIKGGDTLNLGIAITNNNTIALESVDLVVIFPPGAREAGNLEKELSRYRKNLGTIDQSQIVNESVKSVLFGEAGKEQEISVAVEYRTPGSNAIFEKVKTFKVLISASPLNVTLSIPSEVNTGNQVELGLDVRAGSNSNLSNLLVRVDYPNGFQFGGATPKPIFGNNVWSLGDLDGESIRHIKISGTLLGQDGEKKLFRVTAGTATPARENEIAVPYGSSLVTVLMRSSFVNLSSSINGEASNQIVVAAAEPIRADINWTNNLPDKLLNAQVTVHFKGNALDQASVAPTAGVYASVDDTIIWTRQHQNDLAIIEPGASSHVNFDFKTLPFDKLIALGVRNAYVQLEINFQATRVVKDSPDEMVNTIITKVIRVNSQLGLGARAVYSTGPFGNNGPLPPRANVQTTYTILWSLSNSSNELDGVRVTAILPSHARFLGNVSPAGTDIRYDSTTGQISWNVGRVAADSTGASAREAAFQIAVTPSVPQVGQTIALLTDITVSGRDLFTSQQLNNSMSLIDTRIYTDPNFKEDWSKVAP